MLPKLSPSLLFDRSVSKAMFVQPSSIKLPDGDGIISFFRSIDAPFSSAKHKIIEQRSGSVVHWEWVPDSPARLVVLFRHEDPVGVKSNKTLASRIKFISDRDGIHQTNRLF